VRSRKRTKNKVKMMKKERNEKLAALMLIASVVMLAVVAIGSCQLGSCTVGVKAGDWVKYSVTRLGPDTVAWGGPTMKRAVWVNVEVQNVSGTIITARETIHLTDGSDSISTISWDLQDAGS